MIEHLSAFVEEYLSTIHLPNIRVTDVVEILIITFIFYRVLVWVKNTRAWSLLKGLIVVLGFLLLAAMFNMTTILWIAQECFSVAIIALVVVLQPELRRALEQLGKKNILSSFILTDPSRKEEKYSDHTVDEIVKASFAMGRERTGALMVFECNETLTEYEKTGINIDSAISSQLLINIFEHNTPLHDGAVIFRNDRIMAATCYLPLSDNRNLSKALGTRHRAAVGITEITDSLAVIVSEENGKVSVAYAGELFGGLSQEGLREKLELIQNKQIDETKKNNWLNIHKNSKKDKEKTL